MTAQIIDGKAFAATVREKVAAHVTKLKADHDLTPGLAVVLVGEDPASQVYVRSKGKQTVEVGMNSFEHKLDADTSEADLLALIDQLNNDPSVHGILVQLPLPDHLNSDLVINSIAPSKDVDGFHISNVGLLGTGQKSMVPCTPLGCLMMLRDHFGSLSGKDAVVVGRSNIVGKPMAQLLLGDDPDLDHGGGHLGVAGPFGCASGPVGKTRLADRQPGVCRICPRNPAVADAVLGLLWPAAGIQIHGVGYSD